MTRPLRLEFPGALYHVTARGDRKGPIYFDSEDRIAWLDVLATTCARFNFIVHAFCQMTNHYHLVVETLDGDLARGMRQLNGAYSQQFNRRHRLVGHVFQGRYKAILVQKESYLLELARYVVLNPVRAGIVADADSWRWSSHPYFMRSEDKPAWLETDWLLSHFSGDRESARKAYVTFVADGVHARTPLGAVKHQLVLGDKEFVATHLTDPARHGLKDLTRTQRRISVLPLSVYEHTYGDRREAMARAYRSMAYSMDQIADHFGVSPRTVGRAVRGFNVDD